MAGFFRQKEVSEGFWAEDPTAVRTVNGMSGASKRLTALLRHCNTYEFQRIRRTRTQGDVALIDFLLTEAMQKNFPKLCQLRCGLLLTV